MLYPLKFKKVFKEKVWGGRALEMVMGISLPDDKKYGESWEISSHKNGMGIVENGWLKGRSLQELLEEYKEKIVGESVYEKFGNRFPILMKYLDVHDKLSVQVHPDDEYAMRNENDLGKSECWHIIEASEDAKIIMGLNEGITREYFLEKVSRKEFDGIFNVMNVRKGDTIHLRPGLVHATLEGTILICESQENSDVTYRIYDFDRVVDGKHRELNIDRALEVIDFNGKPEIIHDHMKRTCHMPGACKEELVREEHFKIDKIRVCGEYRDGKNKNFRIFSFLDGEGYISDSKARYNVKKGESYLIPAGLEIDVSGELEILKVFL